MSSIRFEEWKNGIRNKQFYQICTLICLFTTLLLLAVYSILTVQRMAVFREKMSDGANLLALRVQDRLSSLQGTSVYLSSLDSVNTLLVQEHPSLTNFSEYDDVLRSVSGSDLSIELLFHKSGKILISDYGLSDYETYFDQEFLKGLLVDKKQPEHWLLRRYQQNIYTDAKEVLSYVRTLPLSSVQKNGYIVVSQSLSSIAKTAASYADASLGDYAVWLEELPLASSTAVLADGQSQICYSSVETAARAAYWMPLGAMMARAVPRPLTSLLIWVCAMLLCALTAKLICRQRMVKLDSLVHEMGGEWTLEEDYEDQVDQLYRIFESLTMELTHARQTTREGMPLLQERLIGELLRTHVPIAERRETLDKCGIWLKNPYFAVVQASLETDAFDEQLYLLVRRNVQTQLSSLGEVYSTYGDGNSILFLLNTREYSHLSEQLESLCETVHDALESFLSINVMFSIGLCEEINPTPHDAYVAARDRLSTLRMLEEQPQEAVMLSHSIPGARLHTETVQAVCDAIVSQDEAALAQACQAVYDRYLTAESGLQEVHKRAQIFLLRTYALLTELEFDVSADQLHTVLHHLHQQTADELRQTLQDWCHEQICRDGEQAEENNQHVEAAMQFIHDNFMRCLSVPEIGEAVNVNPIYLNRLFKSSTGSTLSNYLNQYRCSHAREMLSQTQATVSEISDACGFSEVRSFIRFFKKYYDETPTEYRKRIKG